MNELVVLNKVSDPHHTLFLCASLLVLERAYQIADIYVDLDEDARSEDVVFSLKRSDEFVHLICNNETISITSQSSDTAVDCYNVIIEQKEILGVEEEVYTDVETEEDIPCVSNNEVKRRNIVWELIKHVKNLKKN